MAAQTLEKRPLGALGRMGIVAGMHAVALFVIARSLGLVPPLIETRTEATIIDTPQIVENPPPVPQPRFQQPQITLAERYPDLPPVDAPDDTVTARTEAQPRGPVEGPGSAEPMPRLTAVALDPRHPLSQPPYPPGSIRDNEQGNADVEVYVLPNGRVGEARIVRSTGFERLDRAALEEARRYWRFTPATRDGTPVAQWHRLRVVFKLTNRQ
jgi:protein TonB